MPRREGPEVVSPNQAPRFIIEAIEIDRRRRIYFPPHVTDGLEWFDRSSDILSLMKLDEPGRIVLLSWRDHNPSLQAERARLSARLPDPEAEEALLILADRYRELPGERKGRPTLSTAAMVHLCGPQAFDSHVFVARYASKLEIWSVAYRNERILKISDLLNPNLP